MQHSLRSKYMTIMYLSPLLSLLNVHSTQGIRFWERILIHKSFARNVKSNFGHTSFHLQVKLFLPKFKDRGLTEQPSAVLYNNLLGHAGRARRLGQGVRSETGPRYRASLTALLLDLLSHTQVRQLRKSQTHRPSLQFNSKRTVSSSPPIYWCEGVSCPEGVVSSRYHRVGS